MKIKSLIKFLLGALFVIFLWNSQSHAQNCNSKTVVLTKLNDSVTLSGNTRRCRGLVFRIPKGSRLQIKLTSREPDVYFSMDTVSQSEEEGDPFCEECRTLDEYFDENARKWKVWVDRDESGRAANYVLTLRLTDSPIVEGGVLNGKAVNLPKPPFPDEAKETGASDSVKVKVMLGEDGTVYTALAESGNEVFYQVAEQAAMGARFAPTVVNGKAVRVRGYIVYNFKSD